MNRLVMRSRVPLGDWPWAAPFLLVGIVTGGMALWSTFVWLDGRLAATPGRVAENFWLLPVVSLVFAIPFTLGGLTSLTPVYRVVVDPQARRVLVAHGRPFLWKTRASLPLDQFGQVTLAREDVQVSTMRTPLGKSKGFRRRWQVSLGCAAPVYADVDERCARRLAEALAAAASVPLIEEHGDSSTTRLPADLDRPLVERLASGQVVSAPPLDACMGALTRSTSAGAMLYAGRGFRLRLDAQRVQLRTGPFGLGWPRAIRLCELEQIQVDRRLSRKWRGLLGSRKHEHDLLRLVSDRRVLKLPLESREEAEWLASRLMADLREL